MERNTVCCDKCNLTDGCKHFVAMVNAEDNCQLLQEKLDAALLQVRELKEATLCNCADNPLAAIVHRGECPWRNPEIQRIHRDGLRRPSAKRNREGDGHICLVAEFNPCPVCGRTIGLSR